MVSCPRVTVLMPVYNGEKHLGEAIESILAQTFRDFELLIIDDGSSDHSVEIIGSYDDLRIRLVRNQQNSGITATLNLGLRLAAGDYIVRMDADDISLPERLSKQVAFMDSHQDIGVCGTWVETIGEPSGQLWRYPTRPEITKARLLFTSALAHPSVIMRREKLFGAELFYDPSFLHAEDYELWVRASRHCALSNIGEVLLLYRLHASQISRIHLEQQRATIERIQLIQLEQVAIQPTPQELEVHNALGTDQFQLTEDFIRRADAWLRKLKLANAAASVYDEPAFTTMLAERWAALCATALAVGLHAGDSFWKSELCQLPAPTPRQKLSHALKRKAWKLFKGYAGRALPTLPGD